MHIHLLAENPARRKFMSLSFAIGFAVGIAIVAIVCIIFRIKHKTCEYDERQVAARGLAFKAGFITFVLCQVAVFFIELFTEKPLVIVAPGMLSWLETLFALLIFVEVAIFKDAYFSPNKPFTKRWLVIVVLLALLSILRGFTADDAWFKLINLSAGVFVGVIGLSIFIKYLISKKAEREEEDE